MAPKKKYEEKERQCYIFQIVPSKKQVSLFTSLHNNVETAIQIYIIGCYKRNKKTIRPLMVINGPESILLERVLASIVELQQCYNLIVLQILYWESNNLLVTVACMFLKNYKMYINKQHVLLYPLKQHT